MTDRIEGHVERRLRSVVAARLTDEPVIALHGPRTVGKSVLLTDIAATAGRPRVDLDDADTRAAAEADPALFVSGQPPVCIDEYQHVPALLAAIKAELNVDLRPGRFVLTGSTTYASVPLTAQSLTGRLHRVDVWPLSQGEIEGRHETFVEALLADPAAMVSAAPSPTDRVEYEQRVLRGGMPLALARSAGGSRNRWFDDYVALVVERDVMELSRVRQREVLPKLLGALAGQTGQLLGIAAASRKLGLDPSTGENYVRLLEAAFLVRRLPAWGRTLRARVVSTPKIHVVDAGLAARLLRLTPERLASRRPEALSEFGHLLETFVVHECLKQASWSDQAIDSGHFRDHGGAEVDLVLQRDDGGIIGVEVKAAGRVVESDLRGLTLLRDLVGPAFVGGVVLYLGQRSYTTSDRLHVMPVDRLWRA